ncbi:MAG: DUF4139 domain-containing protein [Planctomycetota bacterium]
MNPDDPQLRDLQERLDEAGRFCRPRGPGWSTLSDRLPPQTAGRGGEAVRDVERRDHISGGKRRRWKAVAIAATALLAVLLGWSLLPQPDRPVRAEPPIEVVRRGVEVTVFTVLESREQTLFTPLQTLDLTLRIPARNNLDIQRVTRGLALVKDRRMILHLREGDNVVKFTDVAASIDPTSVRLVSNTDPRGTKVVEQGFEFDLADAGALLKRSLDHEIVCVGQDGRQHRGYLAGYDAETVVLSDRLPSDDPHAPRPKTQTVFRHKLQAIRFDEMPKELHTRPTLVWRLRTDTPGTHETTLTYLCGDVHWKADYVAAITADGLDRATLDLKAWVTITNESGTAYENARLKLIAGDVNRLRDPWASAPPRSQAAQPGPRPAEVLPSFWNVNAAGGPLAEYKRYAFGRPSTLRDHQIKQLGLFEARGVVAEKRYSCRSQPGGGVRHAEAQLVVTSDASPARGNPLPKGNVMLTAVDADGDRHLLGRGRVDHTPDGEDFGIPVGEALDVVYEHRAVETKRLGERHMIQTCEFRIRNHKSTAARLRATAKPTRSSADWTIVEASHPYVQEDFQTIHFDLRLQPNAEKTIRYTAEYRWVPSDAAVPRYPGSRR